MLPPPPGEVYGPGTWVTGVRRHGGHFAGGSVQGWSTGGVGLGRVGRTAAGSVGVPLGGTCGIGTSCVDGRVSTARCPHPATRHTTTNGIHRFMRTPLRTDCADWTPQARTSVRRSISTMRHRIAALRYNPRRERRAASSASAGIDSALAKTAAFDGELMGNGTQYRRGSGDAERNPATRVQSSDPGRRSATTETVHSQSASARVRQAIVLLWGVGRASARKRPVPGGTLHTYVS